LNRAINRDPRVFDNPELFDPERFLNKDGTFNTTEVYVFGFGKRYISVFPVYGNYPSLTPQPYQGYVPEEHLPPKWCVKFFHILGFNLIIFQR
jgi:hypothetical protein